MCVKYTYVLIFTSFLRRFLLINEFYFKYRRLLQVCSDEVEFRKNNSLVGLMSQNKDYLNSVHRKLLCAMRHLPFVKIIENTYFYKLQKKGPFKYEIVLVASKTADIAITVIFSCLLFLIFLRSYSLESIPWH